MVPWRIRLPCVLRGILVSGRGNRLVPRKLEKRLWTHRAGKGAEGEVCRPHRLPPHVPGGGQAQPQPKEDGSGGRRTAFLEEGTERTRGPGHPAVLGPSTFSGRTGPLLSSKLRWSGPRCVFRSPDVGRSLQLLEDTVLQPQLACELEVLFCNKVIVWKVGKYGVCS